MKLPALLMTVALSGCALDSASKLQSQAQAFAGKPERALLARLGEPDESVDRDGQRWLTWTAEQPSFHEGYWLGFENDSTYVARCRISALVRDQKVARVVQEGNVEDCRFLGMI